MKKNPPTAIPPTALPLGPYVIIDGRDVTATAAGIEAIFIMACDGNFQGTIAAKFQITTAQWKRMLGDASNATPARLAWESGQAMDKQTIIDKVRSRAVAGDMNAALYYGRAIHQLYDKASANISIDQKIGFQLLPPGMSAADAQANLAAAAAEGVMLLPGSWKTEEEYMRSIGQAAIIDARPPDKRGSAVERHGLTPSVDGTPIEPTLIDVTPKEVKAPAVADYVDPVAEADGKERADAHAAIAARTNEMNQRIVDAKQRGIIR